MKLPSIFGHGMVLQHGQVNRVWGRDKPGTPVEVELLGDSYRAVTEKSGEWNVLIRSQPAGTVGTLFVVGTETIVLEGVTFGEVILAAGQSNMAWTVADSTGAEHEIPSADYPRIRYFTVENNVAKEPQADLWSGRWTTISPATAGACSAIAYALAKTILEKTGNTVGIVVSAWGGTSIETWISREGLLGLSPRYQWDCDNALYHPADFSDSPLHDEEVELKHAPSEDSEPQGSYLGVCAADFDDSDWLRLPPVALWDSTALRHFWGRVWYRGRLFLSREQAKRPLVLRVGHVDVTAWTWLNGHPVGVRQTGDVTQTLPTGVAQKGLNTLAICLEDLWFWGGGLHQDRVEIRDAESGEVYTSMDGYWRVHPFLENRPPRLLWNFTTLPTVVFNAMVAPLLRYGWSAVVWYQGENNEINAEEYEALLKTLIADWRRQANCGDLPFVVVQLPSYRPRLAEPSDSRWATIREAQSRATNLPKVGLVVTIDQGDAGDIHPREKRVVGQRAAEAYLQLKGGVESIAVLPKAVRFPSRRVAGASVVIRFETQGLRLRLRALAPAGFSLAASDGQFYWADKVVLSGRFLRVSSRFVREPATVRYAWADNPDLGLWVGDEPVAPFQVVRS